MMVAGDVQDRLLGDAAIPQQPFAMHRVLADDGELVLGQLAGLVEHVQRQHGLAHVMQQAAQRGVAHLVIGQLQLAGQHRHQRADATECR